MKELNIEELFPEVEKQYNQLPHWMKSNYNKHINNNMIECPMCKGEGELPTHKALTKKDKVAMAKLLKKQGYSIRQTMKIMGYKSSRSVWRLLPNN